MAFVNKGIQLYNYWYMKTKKMNLEMYLFIIFMFVFERFAYMYVEARRGCPSLGTRGQDDCKLPRGC